MLKKVIKHLTCRRRINSSGSLRDNGTKQWMQTFRRGYTEQAFRRVCVRANLIHGDINERYLQRSDHQLKTSGKAAKSKAAATSSAAPALPAVSIVDSMSADTVLTKAAAMAVWPC
eukprot:6148444-Pleurochrysis_carterae.AAC.1